mmetsp:Transcript_6597/g.18426  ORF Transcript_6597/g.18426 Transcript_6597/m.18426 type:complete len:648 (+) Transcript_6597:627-2570(+)
MSDTASEGRNDAAMDLIPALKDRYDPSVAAGIGNLDELLGDPLVVIFDHPDVAKVHSVLLVRIKAGTDEDKVGIEVEQMRQNILPVRVAELYSLHAWHVRWPRQVQPNVDDLAAVAARVLCHASPGLGKKEVGEARILDARWRVDGIGGSRLSRRGVEPSTLLIGESDVTGAVAVGTGEEDIVDVILIQPRLVPGNMKCTDCKGSSDGSPLNVGDELPHNLFRAVSVVNIEVDDGNALDAVVAVHAPRIGGTDGHVVEQTKAVRSIGIVGAGDDTSRSSVVSWRPNGAEGVPEVSRHDLVDGLADTASSPHGSFEAPSRNGRIGVHIGNGRWMIGKLRARLADTLDVVVLVDLEDVGDGSSSCVRLPGEATKLSRSQDSRILVQKDAEPTDVLRRRVGAGPARPINRRTAHMAATKLVAHEEGIVVRIHNQVASGRVHGRSWWARRAQSLHKVVGDDHATLLGNLPGCVTTLIQGKGGGTVLKKEANDGPVAVEAGNVKRSTTVVVGRIDFNTLGRQEHLRNDSRGAHYCWLVGIVTAIRAGCSCIGGLLRRGCGWGDRHGLATERGVGGMMVMFVMTVVMRCPGDRSMVMRCTGRGKPGRGPIELGSRVKGSSSDSVRSQIERLNPRLVGQDEPQHAGEVGGACQV